MAGVATLLLTAALRITYPYELEWMEGAVLDHVARLHAGQPIYAEPRFQFVPLIYPPLYYCLCSLAVELVGDGFAGPRLVSLAASIGCLAVIYLLVYGETGRRIAGLSAAGLYAATYPVAGGWFDVARVDSLFLFFALGGAYLVRFDDRLSSSALAGLFFTCAFFTKQATLVFAGPLLLFHLFYHPRRFPVLAATGIGGCALISGFLHWRTGGWFTYYVFSLPRQHAWVPPAHYFDFWLKDLLPYLFVALPMIAALAAVQLRTRRHGPAWDFYGAFALGGLAVSWLSRLHDGGGANVIMPALAAVAVLFGLATAYLPRAIQRSRRMTEAAKGQLCTVVLAAAACQLLLLAFNPWDWVPGQADRKAGDELVDRLRRFHGGVIVPSAPYLAARAGKPATAHQMAIADVLRATGSHGVKRKLVADINRQLHSGHYEAIILFRPGRWFQDTPIPDEYLFIESLVRSPEVFRPKTGAKQFVPAYLFVRRGRRPAGGSEPKL